ncbi:MAG TPA: nucleotidyltransferase family protein [Longimicrobium sp.]
MSADAADINTSLRDWLVRGGELPPPRYLRAAELAAYAYTTLEAGHPARATLAPDAREALAKHQWTRAGMKELFQAWTREGIPFLVFKGFHISEWIYPVPGTRKHGDVDVLVRPEDVERAVAAAHATGWKENAYPEGDRPYYHHAPALRSARWGLMLEVHRWVVQSTVPWNAVQRRITAAVWENARVVEWEGMRVHLPSDVDALLAGLVLHRAWSRSDPWVLRARDAVDVRILRARGITDEEMWARAEALGCARTLRGFLQRCDPAEGRLELARPTAAECRVLDRMAAGERPSKWVEAGLQRAVRLPYTVRWTASGIPRLLRLRWAARNHPDPLALLPALSELAPARGTVEARVRAVTACRLAARIVPLKHRGVMRALAIYAAARRQGWPAVLVSGAGRAGRHWWVELDGSVLPELGESYNRKSYQVDFVYPPDEEARR